MKLKYFIFFFLFWYILTGLALTYVFEVPKAKIQHDKKTDEKCAQERANEPKCGFPAICIGPGGCFEPGFSTIEFFRTQEPYIKIITWPLWFYKNLN